MWTWGKPRREIDVLVVGAGPVGLMAALMLVERGAEVRIIDREKWSGEHNYALTLHPASLKLLDDVGLAGELVAQGTPVRRVAIRDPGGPRAELRLDELPVTMPYLLVLQQAALEKLLEETLRRRGVQVEWGKRLARIEPEPDRVRFAIEELGVDSGGYPIAGHMLVVEREERGAARFVVAADGYHSIARRQLHIDLEPTGGSLWYAVAEVDRDLTPYGEATMVIGGGRADAVWPLPGGGCRWSLQLDDAALPPHATAPYGSRICEPGIDRERLLALLGERGGGWFDGEGAAIGNSLLVHFEPALAQRFGEGRVQLIGDAAHVTSPVGVQSMNAGLREAHDVASRIAQLLRVGGEVGELERDSRARELAWRSLAATAPLPGVDPWIAEHAGELGGYLPATGPDHAALARQLGLRFRA